MLVPPVSPVDSFAQGVPGPGMLSDVLHRTVIVPSAPAVHVRPICPPAAAPVVAPNAVRFPIVCSPAAVVPPVFRPFVIAKLDPVIADTLTVLPPAAPAAVTASIHT